MKIKISMDDGITPSEGFIAPLRRNIEYFTRSFCSHISRLEVHLSEENIVSFDEDRCMMKAHIRGLKTVAVTSESNTHLKAVQGAMNLLKASLKTVLGEKLNKSIV